MENFFINLIKLPLWKKNVIALFVGAVTAFAFPGFYMVGILWISLPFILLLQDSLNTKKQSYWLGFFFGMGFYFCSMFWLYHPLTLMDGRFLWMIPFALMGIAIWGGFFTGLIFYGTSFFKKPFIKIVSFAFFWAVVEYFRSNFIFDGIAWNTVATVWAKNIEIAQISAFIGSYNLTFLTIFVATLPFGLNRKYLISSGVIMAVLFMFGEYRLNKYQTEFSDVTYKIIQPNISQEEKHSTENKSMMLYTLINMSKQKEITDYVIWSETTFPYLWNSKNNLNVFNFPINGNLITGVMRIEPSEDDFEVFNSAVVLKNKEIDFVYDKTHLVPFGEYIPFNKYLPIKKIVPGQKDISVGDNNDYAYIEGIGNIAISICYEMIFSGNLKIDNEKDIDLMINITNDKWFGDTQAPHQHLASAILRAIEEGIPIIRATNSGISAVIDPVGKIINKTEINEKIVITGKFPRKLENRTLFYKYENLITFIFLTGTFLVLFYLRKK